MSKDIKSNGLNNKIRKIFNNVENIHYYNDYKKNHYVIIKCEDDITFDKLVQLSDLLKTKDIDLASNHTTGGCDTCDHGSKTTTTLKATIKNEQCK